MPRRKQDARSPSKQASRAVVQQGTLALNGKSALQYVRSELQRIKQIENAADRWEEQHKLLTVAEQGYVFMDKCSAMIFKDLFVKDKAYAAHGMSREDALIEFPQIRKRGSAYVSTVVRRERAKAGIVKHWPTTLLERYKVLDTQNSLEILKRIADKHNDWAKFLPQLNRALLDRLDKCGELVHHRDRGHSSRVYIISDFQNASRPNAKSYDCRAHTEHVKYGLTVEDDMLVFQSRITALSTPSPSTLPAIDNASTMGAMELQALQLAGTGLVQPGKHGTTIPSAEFDSEKAPEVVEDAMQDVRSSLEVSGAGDGEQHEGMSPNEAHQRPSAKDTLELPSDETPKLPSTDAPNQASLELPDDNAMEDVTPNLPSTENPNQASLELLNDSEMEEIRLHVEDGALRTFEETSLGSGRQHVQPTIEGRDIDALRSLPNSGRQFQRHGRSFATYHEDGYDEDDLQHDSHGTVQRTAGLRRLTSIARDDVTNVHGGEEESDRLKQSLSNPDAARMLMDLAQSGSSTPFPQFINPKDTVRGHFDGFGLLNVALLPRGPASDHNNAGFNTPQVVVDPSAALEARLDKVGSDGRESHTRPTGDTPEPVCACSQQHSTLLALFERAEMLVGNVAVRHLYTLLEAITRRHVEICEYHLKLVGTKIGLVPSQDLLQRVRQVIEAPQRLMDVMYHPSTRKWFHEEFIKELWPAHPQLQIGAYNFEPLVELPFEVDRESLLRSLSEADGINVSQCYSTHGISVLRNLFKELTTTPLWSQMRKEFAMYAYHCRDLSDERCGQLGIMVHSVTQQFFYQNVVLFLLCTALRPGTFRALISYPTTAIYLRSGHGGIPEHAMVLHNPRSTDMVRLSIALNAEDPNSTVDALPIGNWSDNIWTSSSSGERDEVESCVTSPEQYMEERLKHVDPSKWVSASLDTPGAVRAIHPLTLLRHPPVPHDGSAHCMVDVQFVAVGLDQESTEQPELGTRSQIASSHVAQEAPPRGLPHNGAAYRAMPRRFPASVELFGISPISDALVGRRRWDSPAVVAERDLFLRSDDATRAKALKEWQERAVRAAMEAFDATFAAEKKIYGKDSYFCRGDPPNSPTCDSVRGESTLGPIDVQTSRTTPIAHTLEQPVSTKRDSEEEREERPVEGPHEDSDSSDDDEDEDEANDDYTDLVND